MNLFTKSEILQVVMSAHDTVMNKMHTLKVWEMEQTQIARSSPPQGPATQPIYPADVTPSRAKSEEEKMKDMFGASGQDKYSPSATELPKVTAPTVGRIVYFFPSTADAYCLDGAAVDEPLAAIVCYVHSEREVNLHVFGAEGTGYKATSVTMVQPGDERPECGIKGFCEWMPFAGSSS